MRSILVREMRQYFHTSVGYVFLCAYLLAIGVLFAAACVLPARNDLESLFSGAAFLMRFLTPILTMRLIDEDRRQNTQALLSASPLTVTQVVLGKYLSAVGMIAILLLCTMPYVLCMACFGTISWGGVLADCLGFLLSGMAYIGIGLWIAAWTKNAITAVVTNYCAVLALLFLESVWMPLFVAGTSMRALTRAFALYGWFELFHAGVVPFAGVCYYLSVAGACVFLTVRVLDRRRWAEV